MENGFEDSYEAEIPKRSRSLDLKTVYESSISKEYETKSLKRKIRSESIENANRSASKKSRKDSQLCSSRDFDRKKRKSLKAVYSRSLSVSVDSQCSGKLGLSQKLKKSLTLKDVSLCLDDGADKIPRYKHRFVGRNKFEVAEVLRTERVLCSEDDLVNLTGRQSIEDSESQVDFSKVKQKNVVNDLNVDKRCELSSTKILKKEYGLDGGSGTNDCNSSLRELLKNDGIRKGRAKHCKSIGKACESSVEGPVNSSVVKGALPENDEENLKENAARMLSSRFDSSRTGFSSNIEAASRPMNRLPSSKNHDVQESNAFSGPETASLDDSVRLLRLPKNHKVKANRRKRCHYYEISSRDWDAYWVLNRKIKVFWPLDESWYLGLVNDYDENSKLHHVKYEDHDDEWIDLQHEKFKLLLLRSEVPGSPGKKRSQIREKHSGEGVENLKLQKEKGTENMTGEIDTSNGTFVDSLPIIFWLARSSLRVKRKKTFAPYLAPSRSLLCDKFVNAIRCLDSISVQNAKQKLSSSARLSDTATEGGNKTFLSGCLDGLKESKPPIVYFRRRFHRSGRVLSHTTGPNFVTGTVPEVVDSTTSIVDGFHDFDEKEKFHARLDPENDFWLTDDAGNIIINIYLLHSRRFRFQLSFPSLYLPNNKFAAEDFWLVRSKILHHCGMLMAMWPRVHLEILFVDSIVGLRFLCFEGCLKQAISFVVQLLLIFCGSNKQGKFAELQLPVTSIRFKVSSIKDIRKHIVFRFRSFQKVEKTKWSLLDSKLKRHCLFTKQLPLSECTSESMKALQHATKELLENPSCRELSSVEGSKTRRFTQGICMINLSRESCYLNVSQVSSNGRTCAHNSIERPQNKSDLAVNESPVLSLSKDFENSSENNLLAPSKSAKRDGCSNLSNSRLKCTSRNNSLTEYSQKVQSRHINVGLSSPVSNCCEELGCNTIVPLQDHNLQSVQCASLTTSSAGIDRKESTCVDGESPHEQLPSHNPTAPRSTWRRSRPRTISLSAGFFSNGRSAGKANSSNKFGTRPKKRHTQVSYSLPSGYVDFSSRNEGHNQKGIPHKRIQRASEKRLSETSDGSKSDLALLSCGANLLITLGDRGWRQCGAQVVLELFDLNEWKLAVKTSGSTKYSYKAHQVLLPGTTNRYTHAMMWKGGKDWTLEFPDRAQWTLFKEMYNECYNRNSSAASAKNIPIPGVYLMDDCNENGTKASVLCSSSKYIQQVGNDVEMALDPSCVLYDMDTDDERWIWRLRNSSETESSAQLEISEEMFEKTMDMFEKTAYTHDQFGSDEIEELFTGFGPIEVIKSIYNHWRQKRQRKGMPLIRHLQPPLWEKYQQQVKEWELAIFKANSTTLHTRGCAEKVPSIEKLPLFAFCLKPRGLELPNKVPKQRSQKRISLSGKAKASMGDHDGRRSDWYAYDDEKFIYAEKDYESFDELPLSQGSPGPFSPMGTNWRKYSSMDGNGFNRNYYHKLQRSKLNKSGTYFSSNGSWMMTSSYYRPMGKRNDSRHWNMGFCDWSNQRHGYSNDLHWDFPEPCDSYDFEELQNCYDLDELQLHDASGAAKSAHKIARLKREKAQKLLYRADLAIQKAAVALMMAEAARASSEHEISDINDDG